MSDTPRTDELYNSVCFFTDEEQAVDALADLRDLARQLEGELSVANKWMTHNKNHIDDLKNENTALRIERNRYRVTLEDIAEAAGIWASDKARAALERKEAQP